MVCRTSFIKTASDQIVVGQSKLISLHAVRTAASTGTIKIHDVSAQGNAALSNEVCRIIFDHTNPSSPTMIEYDMHGVLCTQGIYLDITGDVAVSVEFA